MAIATYEEKNTEARYIVVQDGWDKGGKVWRIWDREDKKKLPGSFTAKRMAQNTIDRMGDE